MTKEKKSNGKAVRSVKPETTENPSDPNPGMQIHAGNIPIITVKLLDEMNKNLNRIATALEKALEQ